MKKQYLKFIAAAIAAAACISCSDSGNNGTQGPINIYLVTGNDNPLEVSLTSPKDTTIKFTAEVDAVSDGNVTATLKVSYDEVEKFNSKHGTSYPILPAGCYSFDKEEMILPRYNRNSSSITLTLSTAPLEDTEVYLLPLVIDQVKGDDNITTEKSEPAYILFSKIAIPDPVLLTGVDDPSDPWEVVYVSSQHPSEPATRAIDGNEANIWHHKYGTDADVPPFDLVIDMKKTVTVYGVQFVARTNPLGSETLHNTGVLAIADVAVAKTLSTTTGVNASDFEGLTAFDTNTLLWQKYNNAYLSALTTGRYLWLRVHKAYNQGNPTYNGCSLAELYVWGLIEE